MKILFTRFPLESANGGAEKQTLMLMQELQKRGHAVSFLGSCPVLLERCAQLKIENVTLKIGSPPVTKWEAISFFWRKFRMRRQLIKALQSTIYNLQSSDVVAMLSLTEKILLTPYALKQGMKVIWIEHDMVGNWLRKNPSLSTLIAMSEKVTTVCVSELSAEIFRNIGYRNVVAIPNGVEEENREKRIENNDDGMLRVGCIARLSPEKGVDVLLEAMKQVPDATLLLVGKGPQYVQSSQTVTLRYEVPDIETVYNQIDVLVLPSRQEDPFGLVVAEAMMRGIATICTDACGIAGYLTDEKDTLIVPAGDSAALQSAIERYLNPKCRMQIAAEGMHTAKEKFTIHAMVNSYEKVMRHET